MWLIICGQLLHSHSRKNDEAKLNNNYSLITKSEHPAKNFIGHCPFLFLECKEIS